MLVFWKKSKLLSNMLRNVNERGMPMCEFLSKLLRI